MPVYTMYNGEHSITFGPTDGSAGKNTWDDWHLIPTSRPTLSVPGIQNKFVEVPGMIGSYDISEYFTADVVYADRSGTFEFIVDNGHADWISVYETIESYLRGRRLRMVLYDDPGWYYEGRFSLDEFRSESDNSKIVIGYRVAPFKISFNADFAEEVLWDPFCFERDYDWSLYYHIQSTPTQSSYSIVSFGQKSQVSVKLVSGGPVTAVFGGVSKTLSTAGSVETLGFSTRIGSSTLTLSGSGIVDIGWKKVSL